MTPAEHQAKAEAYLRDALRAYSATGDAAFFTDIATVHAILALATAPTRVRMFVDGDEINGSQADD